MAVYATLASFIFSAYPTLSRSSEAIYQESGTGLKPKGDKRYQFSPVSSFCLLLWILLTACSSLMGMLMLLLYRSHSQNTIAGYKGNTHSAREIGMWDFIFLLKGDFNLYKEQEKHEMVKL